MKVLLVAMLALAAGDAWWLTHRAPAGHVEGAPGTAAGANGEFTEDRDAAQALQAESGRPMFILFTGSDWCNPCRLMEMEVFGNPEWKTYTARNLVLLKADFPHHVAQSDARKAQNAQLSKQFKIEAYPSMVLVARDGHELGRLTTLPDVHYFLDEVRKLLQ